MHSTDLIPDSALESYPDANNPQPPAITGRRVFMDPIEAQQQFESRRAAARERRALARAALARSGDPAHLDAFDGAETVHATDIFNRDAAALIEIADDLVNEIETAARRANERYRIRGGVAAQRAAGDSAAEERRVANRDAMQKGGPILRGPAPSLTGAASHM